MLGERRLAEEGAEGPEGEEAEGREDEGRGAEEDDERPPAGRSPGPGGLGVEVAAEEFIVAAVRLEPEGKDITDKREGADERIQHPIPGHAQVDADGHAPPRAGGEEGEAGGGGEEVAGTGNESNDGIEADAAVGAGNAEKVVEDEGDGFREAGARDAPFRALGEFGGHEVVEEKGRAQSGRRRPQPAVGFPPGNTDLVREKVRELGFEPRIRFQRI